MSTPFSASSSSHRPPFPNPSSSASSSSSSSTASSSSSEESFDEEAEAAAMIQEEWEESLRQLEVVLSIVVLPFFGKWYGRRWAYWAYARYLDVGLGKAFLGVTW